MNVLQFSGGLDSLACLILLRDEPGLQVVTCLTDGAYQSTIEYLSKVQHAYPTTKFLTVFSPRHLPANGRPVDVVPLRYTPMGAWVRGSKDVRYQDSLSCCNRGIWEPLDTYSRSLAPEVIYRGQRNDDRLKAPVADGAVDRGVTLRFPIADWTREQVLRFVEAHAPDLLPPGYNEGEKTSRDCWDCTAYLQDNKVRIRNLPPEQFKVVTQALAQWRDDVLTEVGDV